MYTETFGQLVDRLVIARLKEWHYTQDSKTEAAQLAHEQVAELTVAVERYVDDCHSRRVIPRVQKHLRYHDHNQVEAWRSGKKATPDVPATIGGCIAALVDTHSDYWLSQSRIQTIKRLLNDTMDDHESADFNAELVKLQRQHIDLDNQYRNELITAIDTMFVESVK